MKIEPTKTILVSLTVFLIIPILALAEEPPLEPSMPGRIEGTGTYFEITNSEYLNVSLQSTEEITVLLESIPKTISLNIEASTSSNFTNLTIGNLEPNTTYSKFEDSYKNEAVFVSNGQGSYSWTQDLTRFHHLRIEEEKGTIIIPEDCLEYERWDEVTKTCIFINDSAPPNFINSQDNIGLGEWQWTTFLPEGRRYHASVVHNNYLYVIGGLGTDSTAVWYSFISNDGQINQWNFTTSLPKTMANLTAVVYNNYLYIMGGWEPYGPTYNDVWYVPIYKNGEIGDWVPTTPLPKGTAAHTSFVYNGYLYSVGGMYRYPYFPNQYYNSIFRTSINSDGTIGSWIEIGVLPTSLCAHTSFVNDGYLYIAGGFDGFRQRNEVWYTPIPLDGVIGIWATTTPLPMVKSWHTSVLENNKVYIIGGGSDFQNVWYAQIKSDGSIENWSLTNPLLKGRASHSSVSLNGYVYAIGGYDYGSNTYYREVEYASFIAEPPTISNLNQYKSDGITTINEEGITTESTVIFKAVVSDPDNDQVKLEVELRGFDEPFTGIYDGGILSSEFVDSGSEATISRYGLINGQYHWRLRAIDSRGAASDWQEFGEVGNVDFEVKLVPLYTQVLSSYPSDEETRRWSGRAYAYATPENPYPTCGWTIGNCGCAITSEVMLLRFHGVTTDVDNNDVNPLTFNNWLANPDNDGYWPDGGVKWEKIQEYSRDESGFARIVYDGPIDYKDNTTLDFYLDDLHPVILYEKVMVQGELTSHFIVADGKLATTYTIKDPAWYNTKKLTQTAGSYAHDYSNYFYGLRLFSPALALRGVDSISLNLASPAELLVIDPQGRKLGKDPINNVEYNEIPGGVHYQEGIGNPFPEVPTPTKESKNIWIPHPLDGKYDIRVIGTDTGSYTLSILAYDQNGQSKDITYQSSTTAENIQSFELNYSKENIQETQSYRIVNIDIKPSSYPNSINCKNQKGVIPVAILTNNFFDAATVDSNTVRFGPNNAQEIHRDRNGKAQRHLEDIDGDGDLDLILHFKFSDTGIKCGDQETTLTGKTLNGFNIKGSDSIRTIRGAEKQTVITKVSNLLASLYEVLSKIPSRFLELLGI